MNRNSSTSGIFRMIATAAAASVMLWSCSVFPEDELYIHEGAEDREITSSWPSRNPEKGLENVFLVYSMGYNNLSYDLNEDIDEMLSGNVPYKFDDHAVLIFNHSTAGNRSNYKTETTPVLYRAYRNRDGSVIRDTLIVYPKGTVAATKDMMSEVLGYVKETFPATHYGMLVSSHATGWAPEMYCYNPPDLRSSYLYRTMEREFSVPEKYTDARPLTRSIGAHFNGGSYDMDEIELADFADAIPFHLDYLLFDCCFMGGIEVAYELKDKCDRICFSQTEILSGGMDYVNLLNLLFLDDGADLQQIAEDYYNMYITQGSELMRSATVSVVDCRKLDALVPIVAANSSLIRSKADNSAYRSSVQGYFQSDYKKNHGIFYDLEDILIKAEVSEDDLRSLRTALQECIVCKYATPTFLTYLKINHHSGLSMYLPDTDREILDDHYKTLKWNLATGLITDN